MTRQGLFWLPIGLLSLASAAGAQDAAPLVERVDIAQNQFVQKETLLYYVSTKAGDHYDELRVKSDFKRLWETGFLEDLLVDVRDGEKGRIITFVVRERKRIQVVDYRGSKELTNTNIEDELKKRESALKIDTFFDPAKARKVEGIIQEMLQEKGRPFATVKHEAKSIGGAGTQVSFTIDDGPPAKIKDIGFTGNQIFSDSQLRGRMKNLKQKRFWNLSWLLGKTTYVPEKWSGHEGDQSRLIDFYLDRGYVMATVGEPKISYTDGRSGLFKKKPVKWIHLEIPVTEGDPYKVGTVAFEGMTVFKPEGIRPLFKLQTGDTYRDSRLKKGFDKLRDAYGSLGYFQMTGFTNRKPDTEKKVVDLVLTVEEDKKYYVGRIMFTGNDTTRDKVIRREVYLNEGDVFNSEALKLSVRRINQLGYFKPMEGGPNLSQNAQGDDKLDITFKVDEQNRNQFTFGGGVSGLEGTFLNASFSTANFLGLGETLSLSAQTGKRTKNYQIALTEPYLFDRPITAGVDLFKRKLTYETFQNVVGYTQESTGGSVISGLPAGRFSRFFLSYSYEVIQISGLSSLNSQSDVITPTHLTDVVTVPAPVDPTQPIFDPIALGQDGKRRESRITPSIVHNTVDNPYTPRRGNKISFDVPVAGGFLGGTLNYVRPSLETIVYIPHTRKTALGLRAQGGIIVPYGNSENLLYYQRYFLGGETQIRGYNTRTVGPLDAGLRALGGNKFVLFNAEYYFDIGGPLRALLFFDAGQAYLEGQNVDLKKLRTSTGVELRFIMPVINVPFRLIYAINPNRDSFQPRSTFKFAVGTTF